MNVTSKYRVISSDNHIVEPPDLWTANIDPLFKSRAPQLTVEEDGEWWVCDGKRLQTGFGFSGSQTGMRFETPEDMTAGDLFDNVRPGGYIPEEQVKDMDLDGIDVSIIYPSLGLQLFRVPENKLLNEVFRTYNDWVADFCKASPKRLAGIAMINVDVINEAVRELERCKNELNLPGIEIGSNVNGENLSDEKFHPIFEHAEKIGCSIFVHPWEMMGQTEVQKYWLPWLCLLYTSDAADE